MPSWIRARSSAFLILSALAGCSRSADLATPVPAAPAPALSAPASPRAPVPVPALVSVSLSASPVGPAPSTAPAPAPSNAIVTRARLEVSRAVTYDPAWFAIPYPNGDPSPDRGVCTDVVIRSLRTTGLDLQARIHEDILARPAAYTTVRTPDRNIDHRRVTPMLTYLRAHATSLAPAFDGEALPTWQPGDIVVWSFRACPSCNPDHVGIVSDRKGPRGLPLVLHNIGPVPTEDDRLDAWTILGHFRTSPASPPARVKR